MFQVILMIMQQQFLGAFASGIFRTREAQRQQQAGQRVRIYTFTHSCYSNVVPNLRPGRYTRLPWNDVFRTVMTRMEPAAIQGCVLHPSVRPFQYQFRTWGLPGRPSKSASTLYAKRRGHKVSRTILCSKEIHTQSTVRLGMLSRFRWGPQSGRCLKSRGCKPTRPLAT